jgi:hypothetical protein
LQGLLAGVIAGTTTDPRSLGLMQSANMRPVRATLRTDILMDTGVPGGDGRLIKGDYRLTFEAPAAYYSGIGRPSNERGGQAISFSFWSKSGDPTGPDHIEHRRRCYKKDGRPIMPCPDDPWAKRSADGEWEIEIEMFNGVSTIAERRRQTLGQLERARSITEACVVYDEAQLGMTVVTVPEKDYPPRVVRYVPKPNFCGGIYIYQGDRSLYHDDPIPRYYPPSIFYKFDNNGDMKFKVDCRSFIPAGREVVSTRCTMGIEFGSWHGRVWVSPKHITEWDKAHSDVMGFLKRHVVSPRTVWDIPPATL